MAAVKFSPELNLGHLLIVFGMLGTGAGIWGNLRGDISNHDARISSIERQQDDDHKMRESWQRDITAKLDQMLQAIGQLQGSQQAQQREVIHDH